MTYEELLKSLPELTGEQCNGLIGRLKALGALGNQKSTTATGKRDLDDRVLTAVCETLQSLGVEYPSPTMLRKSPGFSAFSAKLPNLYKFLEQSSPERIKQDALLKLALELLYHDLMHWQNVTITALTMMSHIHRIPATISRHFPGYSECGMLSWIVRTKE